MSTEIRIDDQGDVLVVRIIGALDQSMRLEHRDRLVQALGERERPAMALDISGLTELDSTGLGFLISLHKRAKSRGGQFGLISASGDVLNVLQMTELAKVLGVHATVDAFRNTLSTQP